MTTQKGDRAETAYFKHTDKILIVGGTGFIGGHLAERCLLADSIVISLSE